MSVDLAHHKIFRAKVGNMGKGGINTRTCFMYLKKQSRLCGM